MTKPNATPRPRLWGAIALLAGAALVLSACSSGGGKQVTRTVVVTAANGQTTTVTSGAPSTSSSPTKPAKPKAPVHIKLKFSDGSQFGVGIPIIAFFSRRPTSGAGLAGATKMTVNDAEVKGAWYFETSSAEKGYPVEAHYRLQNYWPAHATMHMDLATKGVSAGAGLAYDDSLTLDFATGAANIATVDDSTHMITVTTDGKPYGTFPVSLGSRETPTLRGTKVIMEKGRDISMRGPGYFDAHVKFTQRLTYDGEYLHAAPWNLANIGRVDTSNGCTNMTPAAAQKLYGFLGIGDVVTYPNASGPKMQLGQGYGDWNVSWGQWRTGGLVPSS